jgi:hypothetical protein
MPLNLHKKYSFPLFSRLSLIGIVFTSFVATGNTQNTPLISGAVGFLTSTTGGKSVLQPAIVPVVVAPLGEHLLFESRFGFYEILQQKPGNAVGSGAYSGKFLPSVNYLQLDAIIAPKLTIVAGRFLTPFGTYNERLSPIWIGNFQDAPLISPIGILTSGSSDGLMLRGALFSLPKVQFNYVAYFSVASTLPKFQSARTAGGRADFYFPKARLETGFSYGAFLQDTHYNSFGTHVWWMPPRTNFQLRSEYAHGPHAQGYWIETDYRLARFNGPDSLIGRLEPVFRMEQSFRNSPGQGDGLPATNTQRPTFGLDYNFPREVRLLTSYSRTLSASGNFNTWETSLTYRFLFPAWRGR